MKVLIVRFSSIGDIVLTTPVVRCLKSQVNCEIHYLTFRRFSIVLEYNPFIDKIITIESSIREVLPQLRQEKYNLVIDLHNNIRTTSLKAQLLRPSVAFRKLNIRKLLLAKLRIDLMPEVHIVDRYMLTLKKLGVVYDDGGLDYFIPPAGYQTAADHLPEGFQEGYAAFVIGGRYLTKIFPALKVAAVINTMDLPVVLLGGKEDRSRGDEIISLTHNSNVLNGCGLFTLHESAAVLDQSQVVVTNDTGLMHIASARRKKIVSIWGNTVPELGMSPCLPSQLSHFSTLVQMESVPCRPCSKLGFAKCPKGHFDCMLKIPPEVVTAAITEYLIPTG